MWNVHLWAFLAVAVVIVVTPGVDMALVTRNALVYGRRPALMTSLGINLGIFLWTLAATLGLAAVIAASAAAFTTIKVVGALYLIYLGLQVLRSTGKEAHATREMSPAKSIRDRVAFRQGLVSNALNPKIAVFFTSLLPQFVGPDPTAAKLLLLGVLFNLIGVFWLLAYAVAAARGREVLTRPKVKRLLDRASGVVLVGLGVRLALERRT
jgi:RhtB (resistance to homoserine/threonine) family protein